MKTLCVTAQDSQPIKMKSLPLFYLSYVYLRVKFRISGRWKIYIASKFSNTGAKFRSLGIKWSAMLLRYQAYLEIVTFFFRMVFSREAINQLVTNGEADCHADDSPDDMTLGMRYKRLGISLVHSPYFHQVCQMNLFLGVPYIKFI